MKGIRLCFECADYDKKKHRCLRGAKTEDNPQDPFYDDCPLPDVAPVVHGRWITDESGVSVCSNCGEEHEWDEYRPTYCEDCGAKMDGKEKSDENS